MFTVKIKKQLLFTACIIMMLTLTIDGSSKNNINGTASIEESSKSKKITWWNWVNNYQPSLYQLLELIHVNDVKSTEQH